MSDQPAHGAAERFTIGDGVAVTRTVEPIPFEGATQPLIDALDLHRGVLLSSNYEVPGRYTRWDIGFDRPPLELSAIGDRIRVTALNARGEVLLPAAADVLALTEGLKVEGRAPRSLEVSVARGGAFFAEEDRSRQPSVFLAVRALTRAFFCGDEDGVLGLYGAFGYPLAYQFERPRRRQTPDPAQRDLALFLPDRLVIVDHYRRAASIQSYEFTVGDHTTEGLPRDGEARPYRPRADVTASCDHAPGAYANTVREALERFRAGDLFEVVPGQSFTEPCPIPPSEVFRRLYRRNPAPYSFLMNLGQDEYLIGASPEMYVRVEGRRVETAPISGTIRRGEDAIGDARQILELLSSPKEESELTMCTDVDRNDKSRICEPGSVRVIGRRQIEMYSRLIHTVDHVEGILREGYDALDAFLSHTWAVTVTGAPKKWAMQFIEDHEKSPRSWYGGAVGMVGFDGNLNTGLTLRTIHVKDGVGIVRAGATLLIDSDPDAEERETRLKAEAFIGALREDDAAVARAAPTALDPVGTGRRLLFVDHEDSFVHTLANYFRQTGAEVLTWRSGFDPADMVRAAPDMVILSPGPGTPSDFGMDVVIGRCLEAGLPLFGICLGLQGMVEHLGGRLGRLDYPMHGKPSEVRVTGGQLFAGLPERFTVGRYHSLHAVEAALPDALTVTARTEDGVVMAVEHRAMPMAAVQFHPESIMTLEGDVGRRIVANAVRTLTGGDGARAVA